MAFLDDSGDIILDAVLTDLGRMRLARGDSSFKITQWAAADDEINYNLYDKTLASGKEDITILEQTPILEGFTNNTTMLKSKLVTYTYLKHLFLPILKLNQNLDKNRLHSTTNAFNRFVVAADKFTAQGVKDTGNDGTSTVGIMPVETLPNDGYINGVTDAGTEPGGWIRIDQGIDNNTEKSPTAQVDDDLYENQYAIEMDGRLGSIVSRSGGHVANPNFTRLGESMRGDDDFSVVYYLTMADNGEGNGGFVTDIKETTASKTNTDIKGPRGSKLEFKIRTKLELQQSTSLFSLIGKTGVTWTNATSADVTPNASTIEVHYIDTTIKVSGLTTGARLDIPIRIVKKA